jgi:hypothetical protein
MLGRRGDRSQSVTSAESAARLSSDFFRVTSGRILRITSVKDETNQTKNKGEEQL